MNDESAPQPECVTIKVSGDFSFALRQLFDELLEQYPAGEHCFTVDMSDVHELDSSALAMLLRLRDHSREGERVNLLNPRPAIMGVLREAKYPGWFNIVET